jgi:hypothetical protein
VNIFELLVFLFLLGGGWIVGYYAGGALGGSIGVAIVAVLLFLLMQFASTKTPPAPK